MENNRNNTFLTVIMTLFFVALAGGVGYLFYQNQQLKNQAYHTSPSDNVSPVLEKDPSPTVEPTIPAASYTEETNVPNQKKYTSPRLGISFLYLSPSGGSNWGIKEIGNKIYVYDFNFDYDSGQYLELFTKDSGQTLKQAIVQTFLEGYSSDDCLATSSPASGKYPATYIEGNIIVPGEFTDMEEMSQKWQLCPQTYTRTNGISYFITDEDHPESFVFFSIGQYAISAGPDLTWQDTITFLD